MKITLKKTQKERYRIPNQTGSSYSKLRLIKSDSPRKIDESFFSVETHNGEIDIFLSDQVLVGTVTEFELIPDSVKEEIIVKQKNKEIRKLQEFRADISESRNKPFKLAVNKVVFFDESYYTGGFGDIIKASRLEAGTLLSEKYEAFSGKGFGALKAAFYAAGGASETLLDFWQVELRKSLKSSVLGSIASTVISSIGIDNSRFSTKPVERVVRNLFKIRGTSLDLTLQECKKDFFVEIEDINGRLININKRDFPSMPLYQAVCLSLFDPLFFDVKKPQIDGFNHIVNSEKTGILSFLSGNNSASIISIGSPVRCYKHSAKSQTRESLSLILSESYKKKELERLSNYRSVQRLECSPIDELKQFDFSDYASLTARKSGGR